jgi:hypothetical protein
MAIYRQGIKTTVGTQLFSDLTNLPQNAGGNNPLLNQFTPVRVTDIILNDLHPKYSEVGEWNGIGTIFYETIGINEKSIGFAYPFDPHCKTFPLSNELVLIVKIPSKFTDDNKDLQYINYYFNPVGIWNHPHHNASPKLDVATQINSLSAQQQNDYNKTFIDVGYVRRVEDGSTDINLNYLYYPNPSQNTFVEKTDIHPLLPFAGDVMFEGRNGQSIRFGSTSKLSSDASLIPKISNNWSSTGNNGDPITIIRNGQPNSSSNEGWIPITENIRNDLSSIYLTSYQQLKDFKVASELYQSYKTQPIAPSLFTLPQIALNSNRIVINASSDSVLLSADKSIGLSTGGSVNIDAASNYISSNDIRLGSKDAKQSILLGDDTIEILRDLTFAIKDLATILQVERNWPEGVLSTSYNSIAGNAIICLDSIMESLNNNSLKSKSTKVI